MHDFQAHVSHLSHGRITCASLSPRRTDSPLLAAVAGEAEEAGGTKLSGFTKWIAAAAACRGPLQPRVGGDRGAAVASTLLDGGGDEAPKSSAESVFHLPLSAATIAPCVAIQQDLLA